MSTTSSPREWLTMIRVEKDYVFDDGERRMALPGLFEGDRLLVVYQFPFDVAWEEAGSCSHLAEGLIGRLRSHARDFSFVAVSRAPYERVAACKQRLGWRFPWVASLSKDFDQDFPGISVFFRHGVDVFHASSTPPGRLDAILGLLAPLDEAPAVALGHRRPARRAARGSSG